MTTLRNQITELLADMPSAMSAYEVAGIITDIPEIAFQQSLIEHLGDKVGSLSQLLDNQLGTPCESIRHTQEMEKAQARIDLLKAALTVTEEGLRVYGAKPDFYRAISKLAQEALKEVTS